MPPGRRRDPPRDPLAGRNGDIWKAYMAGANQDAIATQYGITQGRVSQILTEVRATIPAPVREHLIQREQEFLDHLRLAALDLVDRPPIPAYSNGRPIVMPDGSIAEDHSGRLAALDRALRVHERLTRLLGLEASSKVDITVTEQSEADRALDELVAEMERRAQAETEESSA